jgi:hypothetical protein
VTARATGRAMLALAALVSVQLGLWAAPAPRSFYDDFPGGGRSWVSADGPYNEHLVRDFGSLNLAIAVVLAVAAWTTLPTLVRTAPPRTPSTVCRTSCTTCATSTCTAPATRS